MSASANLNALLNAQSLEKYYQQQLLVITKRFEANEEKLKDQQSYEEKYYTAYDAWNDRGDKDLKDAKGRVWFKKDGTITKYAQQGNYESIAEAYAHAKVTKFDEEILDSLTNKDVKFDTLKTTFQAMCDSLDAEIESLKTSTSEECGNTYELNGGGV